MRPNACQANPLAGIKARMRRRPAPHCPASDCPLQSPRGDFPPGRRVCKRTVGLKVCHEHTLAGIKGEARRPAPDLPPGGRVCNRGQQNIGGRG